MMKNELRIKPLIKYTVTTGYQPDDKKEDIFTAESYEVIDNCRYIFYRTGNIVREYANGVTKLVATPVDD